MHRRLSCLVSMALLSSACGPSDAPDTVEALPAPISVACGSPSYDRSADPGLYLFQDCQQWWHVRAVAGGRRLLTFAGQLSTPSGVRQIKPVALEGNDSFRISPTSTSFRLNAYNRGEDGFAFRLAAGATATLRLDVPQSGSVLFGQAMQIKSVPLTVGSGDQHHASGSEPTLFVDGTHPAASDDNPGTAELPFRTISKAAAVAVAGDYVVVKAGTYAEEVHIAHSGTSESPIIFEAEGPVDVEPRTARTEFGSINARGITDIIIRGFRVTGSDYGINVAPDRDGTPAERITIQGNYATMTASSGIRVLGARDVTIVDNEIEKTNYLVIAARHQAKHEMISIIRTDTFSVRSNEVWNGTWLIDGARVEGKEGIDIQQGSKNGEVIGNYVHDLTRLGIYVDTSSRSRVTGNKVRNCQQGIALASEGGGLLSDVVVANNIVYSNVAWGIILPAWVSNGPRQDIAIVNNTGWGNGSGGISVATTNAQNVILQNNLMAGPGGAKFHVTDSSVVTTSDGNLAWDGNYGNFSTGVIRADPALVDPSSGDFSLREESEAIDRAVPVLSVTDDAFGTPRPQGLAYDIGAIEYTDDVAGGRTDAGSNTGGMADAVDGGDPSGSADASIDAGVATKYHPGHYIAINKTEGDAEIVDSLRPGVRGVQVRYTWRSLEPTEGQYDFAKLRSDLDLVASQGATLIALVVDKSFDTSVPTPDYLASQTLPNIPGGYSLVRWDPVALARTQALMTAIGEAFDSHAGLEAVGIQESAPGLSAAQLTETSYTPEKYRDTLIAILTTMKQALPRSQVFWYMNFLSQRQNYIASVAAAVAPLGVSMGGPDILPESTSLVSLTYPFYDQFAGHMTLFCSAQFDSYAAPKSAGGYYTMQEIFEFARDDLHVSYVLWNRKTWNRPEGSYTWLDALPVIAKTPTFNHAADAS